MTREWRPLDETHVATLPVNTGVYALREGAEGVVQVYVANGRSRFGLRGELAKALASRDHASLEFTYVSTNNYLTLLREWHAFPDRFDAINPFIRADGVTVAQRGPA